MVQLQRVEAYSILALQKQHSALCINHTPPNDNDTNLENEITFTFPTLFEDAMSFIPVMD
jgi:hypothetical protein